MNQNNWMEFTFGKLINKPYKATAYAKDDLEVSTLDNNSIRYITRTAENNGCELLINCTGDLNVEDGNCITIGDTTATIFYQDKKFITGDHMVVIRAPWMNIYLGLYFVTLLKQEQYKYSYGRAYLMNRISETIVKLPCLTNTDGTIFIDDSKQYSSEGFVPDWKKMESYIKTLYYRPITTKNTKTCAKEAHLDTEKWQEFSLNELFILKGGFYNKKPEHSDLEANIPFLASTESNNGVTEMYSLEDIFSWDKTGNPDSTLDKKIFDGNTIAVTVNGSVCNAFYQKDRFTCSHDITVLSLKNHTLNVWIAQFLCTVIMNEKYRWSYGRKPHDVKKFGKSVIKLPVKLDASENPIIDEHHKYSNSGFIPDFDYMEKYIKNLPYGDKL